MYTTHNNSQAQNGSTHHYYNISEPQYAEILSISSSARHTSYGLHNGHVSQTDPARYEMSSQKYKTSFIVNGECVNVESEYAFLQPESPDNSTSPTLDPDSKPTVQSTYKSTEQSACEPTVQSTYKPTVHSTNEPTVQSTYEPTVQSTCEPTVQSTNEPTVQSAYEPTVQSTCEPTVQSTDESTGQSTSEADDGEDSITSPSPPSGQGSLNRIVELPSSPKQFKKHNPHGDTGPRSFSCVDQYPFEIQVYMDENSTHRNHGNNRPLSLDFDHIPTNMAPLLERIRSEDL
jgi:hypothetical protein